MDLLKDKVAIVTGAGQGIGRGIALALASEGARIAVVERNESGIADTVPLIEERGAAALGVPCDVRDPEQVQRAVAATVTEFGGVDILVNNAQSFPLGRIVDVSDDAAQSGWESGPLAVLRFMRAAHPYLKQSRGCVVNISAGAATMQYPDSLGVYSAVKAATLRLSKAAAVEWGEDGIRVNVVFPVAESPTAAASREMEPGMMEKVAGIPLGHVGRAEQDIGRGVVYLCGPDASYVTGTVLAVDGGSSHLG
jgi:NAD(P)-dependent dehydrogenase (short-subunit alcohol dehydrogenase family)